MVWTRILSVGGLAVTFGMFALGARSAEAPPARALPACMTMKSITQTELCSPIAVAPGAPGTHPLTVAAPDDVGVAPEALAKAQAYSDSLGGQALIVWREGKIRYERYGPGITEATRFETFSMHKSVMGLLFGVALHDGIIRSLNDRVGDYIDEWRHDPRGDITLRQLLSMESGLQRSPIDNPTATALALQAVLPPGTQFEYNNGNSQIAGLVISRALKRAGKGDYADFLSRALLRPLGADDAHLWLDHEGGDPHFYAYLQMRARNWLRIGIMIIQQGRFDGQQVAPASWIKAMTSPSALNPNYGLQMWIGSPWKPVRLYGPNTPLKAPHARPYLVSDLVFFDGFLGQRVYMSPSLNLVIVRTGEPSPAFDDSIIPNDIIEGLSRR